MKDYKAIFETIESTLLKIGSQNLSEDQIRARLEDYKHVEGQQFTDDQYYQKLVKVVFYSGFRAQTVTGKLPIIQGHFPRYDTVADYGEHEVESILNDKPMIKNKRKVDACIENAKTFRPIVGKYGSFQKFVDSFEPTKSDTNLKRLKEDLQQRFKGLGGITTYHFLTSIGMPVLKPDRVIKRIFARLGLVETGAEEWAFVQEGRKFAQATGHPIRYIDIVFVAYGQVQTKELGVERGICLEQEPTCSVCGVTKLCEFYGNHRTAAQAVAN